MAQLNLHTTPEFESHLAVLMRLRAIPSKSEAIRMAVAEQAKAAQMSHRRRDFSALVGLIKPKQRARFENDDALWEQDKSSESDAAEKSRESDAAEKSRESGTVEKSRESGTADTPHGG
jgi:hypothetical protein